MDDRANMNSTFTKGSRTTLSWFSTHSYIRYTSAYFLVLYNFPSFLREARHSPPYGQSL